MKEIIYNEENVKEEEINRVVKRAKVLIINSDEEILYAHSNNHYFFVGGRVEEGESFEEALVREVKEETGIDIPLEKRNPICTITYMNRNYPEEGINTKSVAHYYLIKSDIKPNLDNANLTEEEKSWNFELKYIHKDKAVDTLNEALKVCNRKNTVIDTLEVTKEYLRLENK